MVVPGSQVEQQRIVVGKCAIGDEGLIGKITIRAAKPIRIRVLAQGRWRNDVGESCGYVRQERVVIVGLKVLRGLGADVADFANRRPSDLMLDAQRPGLHVWWAEIRGKVLLESRSRIGATRNERQVGRANAVPQERSVCRQARTRRAWYRAEDHHRSRSGRQGEQINVGWVHV